MIRHIHNPGGRNWFNEHTIELQSEPFKAIDAFGEMLGSFVLSGCNLVPTVDGAEITTGIVCLRIDGVRRIMPFAGAEIDTKRTYYLSPTSTVINGTYDNPVNPAIANDVKAVIGTSVPSGTLNSDYFNVASMPRLIDKLLAIYTTAGRVLPTNAQVTTWDGKLAASEVVTSPQANKVLKLNSSSKLPASITGDAATVGGLTPAQVAALALVPSQLEFVKNDSGDTITGYATLIGSMLTVSVEVDATYINTGGVDKLFVIQGLSASETLTKITLMATDTENPGVYTPIIGTFVGGVVSLAGQSNGWNVTGYLSFSSMV